MRPPFFIGCVPTPTAVRAYSAQRRPPFSAQPALFSDVSGRGVQPTGADSNATFTTKPSSTIRMFSMAEQCLRVARQIRLSTTNQALRLATAVPQFRSYATATTPKHAGVQTMISVT